jgi:hypothetical protein
MNHENGPRDSKTALGNHENGHSSARHNTGGVGRDMKTFPLRAFELIRKGKAEKGITSWWINKFTLRIRTHLPLVDSAEA